MADTVKAKQIVIKRLEHTKMLALSNIQSRELRIMELEEEIERNKEGIAIQKKVVEETEKSIKLEMEKK